VVGGMVAAVNGTDKKETEMFLNTSTLNEIT
jgi:hypothetical protein